MPKTTQATPNRLDSRFALTEAGATARFEDARYVDHVRIRRHSDGRGCIRYRRELDVER